MEMPALVLDSERKAVLDGGFAAAFGGMPERYFSAPGRTEIGGNHTDHQRGCVIAAAVNLATVAAVRKNETDTIRIFSEGYGLCQVKVGALAPTPEEINSTPALVRGVAAGFARRGYPVGGFDAYCTSEVLSGSGLSSSAAYEVLVGTILNGLFCDGAVQAEEIAAIGQYAENVYFGKPCGLMDQMASAVGGLITMDFADKEAPAVRTVEFDFSTCGHALCIIDSGANHADLTDDYAAIPEELKHICSYFGKEVLTEVPEEVFYAALPCLRQRCIDRAVLRGIHIYQENRRVVRQVAALEQGDFAGFLELVKESGRSSWMYLQNVIPSGDVRRQSVAVALALCEKYLEGEGAFRVHGGGFAGTVQAFVPNGRLEDFKRRIEAVLGAGTCQVLTIRPQGGTELLSCSKT